MVLQPASRTAANVAISTGGLLPHLFTLTRKPKFMGGYFLFRYYTLTNIFPLGSAVLCVARTFLILLSQNAIERTAFYFYIKFFGGKIGKCFNSYFSIFVQRTSNSLPSAVFLAEPHNSSILFKEF
jgi:hypothetical protein